MFMLRWTAVATACLLAAPLSVSGFSLLEPFAGCEGGTTLGCPSVVNTSLRWFEQRIDHFNWAPPLAQPRSTFKQRVFVHTGWWRRGSDGRASSRPGPILFYFGNEDHVELYVNHTGAQKASVLCIFPNVAPPLLPYVQYLIPHTLYVNHTGAQKACSLCIFPNVAPPLLPCVQYLIPHTGLMWEAARPLGAALVFAEHRYYGESRPFERGTAGCMSYLTSEQAMADYATILYALRDEWNAWDSPVIGFGGSYGGMLAAWFRLKYPNAIDGVLAASAPIWSFVGLDPPYDEEAFYDIVTRDASAAGGAAPACAIHVRKKHVLSIFPNVAPPLLPYVQYLIPGEEAA